MKRCYGRRKRVRRVKRRHYKKKNSFSARAARVIARKPEVKYALYTYAAAPIGNNSTNGSSFVTLPSITQGFSIVGRQGNRITLLGLKIDLYLRTDTPSTSALSNCLIRVITGHSPDVTVSSLTTSGFENAYFDNASNEYSNIGGTAQLMYLPVSPQAPVKTSLDWCVPNVHGGTGQRTIRLRKTLKFTVPIGYPYGGTATQLIGDWFFYMVSNQSTSTNCVADGYIKLMYTVDS